MTDRQLLPEVGEADAEGDVARLYQEIRTTLRIPFVGLIYRTLAVKPGRLESAWQQLRPFFAHPATWQAATDLHWAEASLPPVPPVGELGGLGLGARFLMQATATLDAYDRANRLNLLGLSALLVPLSGVVPVDSVERPTPGLVSAAREELLPMLDAEALPSADRAVLLEMSQALLPSRDPVLVPSLLRHFALPGLLGRIWPAVRPAIAGGFVATAAVDLRRQAAAAPIPPRQSMSPILDPAIRPTAERFLVATSTMVVTGAVLRRALEA